MKGTPLELSYQFGSQEVTRCIEVGDEHVIGAVRRVVLGESGLDGLGPVGQLRGPGDAAGPIGGVGGVGALIARRNRIVVAGPADAVL